VREEVERYEKEVEKLKNELDKTRTSQELPRIK